MPEGDTVWKIARALDPLLRDRRIRRWRFQGRRSQPAPAQPVVTDIEAVGKHLLLTLDRSAMLRVHLGLHGRWHRYAPGEPWRRPRRLLSVALATEDDVVTCFRARSVELFGAGLRGLHPILSQLGPDLLVPPVDEAAILQRVRALGPGRAISAVLLDQRIAAGIGNVYRNEVLFLHGVPPDVPADTLDPERIRTLFRTSARLMAWNLEPGWRITTRDAEGHPVAGRPRHWVYGRAGQPCLRCGRRIGAGRQLEDARPTFTCPGCQPAPAVRARAQRW